MHQLRQGRHHRVKTNPDDAAPLGLERMVVGGGYKDAAPPGALMP